MAALAVPRAADIFPPMTALLEDPVIREHRTRLSGSRRPFADRQAVSVHPLARDFPRPTGLSGGGVNLSALFA